jgi:hypothetical protein
VGRRSERIKIGEGKELKVREGRVNNNEIKYLQARSSVWIKRDAQWQFQ